MKIKNEITEKLAQTVPSSDELIQLMLQRIGDLNPDLRDETIYLSWIKLLKEKCWTISQKTVAFKTNLPPTSFL